MKNVNISLRAWGERARLQFERITSGDGQAVSLPEATRRNLRWFWFDGLFASASENIVITYLVLYLLAMGATRGQIGLLSSLSSLMAAAVLLPGAMLVERWGRRKQITVLNGVVSRAAILLLALAPLVIPGPAAVYVMIALSATRDAAINLPYPAWMSLTAEVVPLALRGRYFASRNMAMGLAAMLVVYLMGKLITGMPEPAGYQAAMALAFGLGLLALFSFSHLTDAQSHGATEKGEPYSLRSLLSNLGGQPAFLALCGAMALWNFSLNFAGPFFNVYLVQNLGATAAQVGVLSIISSLAGLLVARKAGELADRWGARKLQLVSSLLIPVLPVCWVFFRSPWHVAPLNIASGILWTAHGLASFNFLLALMPAAQRARYSALYQIVVTVALALGAAAGGFAVTRWGFNVVFIGSGVGRMAAALLFARFVRSRGEEENKQGAVYGVQ
jgi:MFS family permease